MNLYTYQRVNELLLWQLAYHLSGSTLLGITEQEPLGSLPLPIRTAVLKTVDQFKPDAIDLRLNKKSPLDFAEGEYEWVENWNYKNYLQIDTIGKQQNNLTDPCLVRLLQKLPEHYSTYQKVALKLLKEAVENHKSHLTVADFQPMVATFALAILDIVALVERVAQLYDLSVILPKIEIYLVGSIDEFGVTQLLRYYRGVDLTATANCIDSSQTSIQLVKTKELPKDVDFILVSESLNSYPSTNSYSFNDLKKIADDFVTLVGNIPPLQAYPVSFERPILDYFARRYFLVPEIKPEQLEIIQKALRNGSGLGLLPTGFGKSLIFQLYALLIPRTTLVISPLNALIRDQIHNLNRIGLKCVESITSSDSSKKKKDKLATFHSGLYRLLYISPERLQISEFYNDLKAKMQESPVGALVIDEAHCVSEWGHDFRPAYLQIERLQQSLEDSCGRKVPIIALTATASEPVRKDIMRVLRLSQENVVQLVSSDRPELSLSVHIVDKPENKPKILTRLIKEVVPQVLDISFEELISSNQDFSYPHAGVVFGIYASPQGSQTIVEGVHHIAYTIKKDLIYNNKNLVQVHASASPKCCPECGSTVLQNQQKELCKCIECGALFKKSDSKNYSTWTKHVQEQQDKFQNNKFPLLVATKGYGMGIDKRNIRFIIHQSLSSSLEAYYQEAGRAGRDRKHAHVALMYHAPHIDCQKRVH